MCGNISVAINSTGVAGLRLPRTHRAMPAHRFLIVWICTLPLALFRNFQYVTPLVCAIVAFLLIGVENIGVQVCPPVPAAQLLTFFIIALSLARGSSCQLYFM